ncbi:putative aflatoxin b1 aldehyde reductase-like protein [Aspergillus sergii]|uniref:D-xylose reductase [NAD(P)H] n=1 Tax=Aspergillus sergii TaxID=1034303 RepID=A0A5N6X7M0_9EURO|nr:putative aflatoxin b1 aldehyde reductase-like protein [Aspergillus sergii]
MTSQTPFRPRTILGLMTFGPDPNKGARITSLPEFAQCLEYLKSQGYNEVDTARMYLDEKQEEFTAAVGWKERGLSLATKVYPTEPGIHKPASLQRKFRESLAALQTDRVDIFYLHAADRSVPFAETLKAVDELYKEGRFKRLGLSNYTAFEVAEIVIMCAERGWVRPTIYQAMYNAITRNIETELIPCCRRYGLEIVVYNPLAGGILSGKYQTGAAVPEEGRFSDKNTTGALYRRRYLNDSVLNALDIIRPVAEKHGLTLPDVAFRWLCHHSQLRLEGDGKDGILIGVSSFGQLQQNLTALQQGPLPDELVDALDEAWMCVKPVAANYWHLELRYTYDTQAALFGQ